MFEDKFAASTLLRPVRPTFLHAKSVRDPENRW